MDMAMTHATALVLLAAIARWTVACSPADEETMTGDRGDDGASSQQAHDERVCREETDDLFETECPPGFAPQFHYGDTSTVLLAEDVAVPICGGKGFLVDFGAVRGARWVGYEATMNSVCAFGCFAGCGPGQMGCFDLEGGAYCSASTDEQSCTAFVSGGDGCGLEPPADDGDREGSG
jgi:hypothetical protein